MPICEKRAVRRIAALHRFAVGLVTHRPLAPERPKRCRRAFLTRVFRLCFGFEEQGRDRDMFRGTEPKALFERLYNAGRVASGDEKQSARG